MEGKLRQHCRHGWNTTIDSWIELQMSPGELLDNGFNCGSVILTYSDQKHAQTFHCVQVLQVIDSSNADGLAFTVQVSSEGFTKELVFACVNMEQKETWTQCIKSALLEVKNNYKFMQEEFTLTLEFFKEKLGIRVEENVFVYAEYDEKEREDFDSFLGNLRKSVKGLENCEKRMLCSAEMVVNALEQIKEEAVDGDIYKEVPRNEKPC